MPQDFELGQDFFEGRLLVEIVSWDASLHVGLSSDAARQESKFQGGLAYVRGFDIEGRVVAPGHHRDKTVRLWLSPFGPDIEFGLGGLDEVGQIRSHVAGSQNRDLSATLLVPENALPMAATCLSSIWKYAHIWTFDEDPERASISAFAFSAAIHENLQAWAAETSAWPQ